MSTHTFASIIEAVSGNKIIISNVKVIKCNYGKIGIYNF